MVAFELFAVFAFVASLGIYGVRRSRRLAVRSMPLRQSPAPVPSEAETIMLGEPIGDGKWEYKFVNLGTGFSAKRIERHMNEMDLRGWEQPYVMMVSAWNTARPDVVVSWRRPRKR